MKRIIFPLSGETRPAGVPRLNPGRATGRSWLKSILGRPAGASVKRQPRMTQGGGGAKQQRPQSPLKVYRRRTVIKVSYTRSNSRPRWAAHARYLTREHAQQENERGIGFDAERDRVNMEAVVDRWQNEGTPLMWRFIISPDDSDRVDLREHVREFMAEMERDLGTRLEWTAIDHYPHSEHDHVHLLIRGIRDDGHELQLDREYVTKGIRELSQSIIERELGPRNEHEMLVARERGIQAKNWTDIDRALQQRQDAHGIIAYAGTPWTQEGKDRVRQEVERLTYLEDIGLAERIGESTWKLSPDHYEKLRELQQDRDILKQRARQQGLEREHA